MRSSLFWRWPCSLPLRSPGAAVPGPLYRRRCGLQPAEGINVQTGRFGTRARNLEHPAGFAGCGERRATRWATASASRWKATTVRPTRSRSRTWPVPRLSAGRLQTYGVMANALFDIDVGVALVLSLYRRRRRLCLDQLRHFRRSRRRGSPFGVVTRRHPGRLRLSGYRRPLLSDAQHAGPFAHHRISLLRHRRRPGDAADRDDHRRARSTVQASNSSTTTASCSACATRSTLPAPVPVADPAAWLHRPPRRRALLSGVLRLGQGDADRSRPPDHQGSGRQFHPGAVHADRGERLHRHVRHAPFQPISPPRARGAGGAGQGRRAAECHHHPGFGDTQLLVQTGPGVREPQNRRVEIIIR